MTDMSTYEIGCRMPLDVSVHLRAYVRDRRGGWHNFLNYRVGQLHGIQDVDVLEPKP